MGSLRPEEGWARLAMSRALGVPVVQYDDGSRNGMHDLQIIHRGAERSEGNSDSS